MSMNRKDRYPMVNFYIDSRKKRCGEDTNELCRERLNTILDDLIRNYRVTFTDSKISGLTGPVLQQWYNDFIVSRKPSTINNYLAFFRPFMEWAYDMEYVDRDFRRILKSAKVQSVETLPEWERPKEKYLSHEEARLLLNTQQDGVNAARNRAIIALFLYSGIRVSELCSLTVGSVTQSPEGLIYCKRKGGCWKYVEVAFPFYDYLSEYFLSSGRTYENVDEPLFLTTTGKALNRRLIYLTLAPVQKKLGIATGSHALRHTYISEVDKIGGPTIARDLANHSSLKITNRYDHTSREQRLEVLNKLSW